MRASTIVMIGFAVVFGLLAVFIAQVWLNNQASMQAKNFESKPAVAMQSIVVAKQPLRFGPRQHHRQPRWASGPCRRSRR